MKNNIIIFLSLLFLASCTNIYFESPQPTYLENIDEFPTVFQGNFERVEKSTGWFGEESKTRITNYIISDKFCVIDNDTLEVGSDDLIIKYQGNNLYVNLKKDSIYELYVLNRYNYFGSDSLIISTFFITTTPRDNYINYPNPFDYFLENEILDSNEIAIRIKENDGDLIIDDSLNVNELNTLLNYNQYKLRLKFNK